MVCSCYIKHFHQTLTELPQIPFSDKVQCSLSAVPSIDGYSLLSSGLVSQKSEFESIKDTLQLKQMQLICFRPINTGGVCLQGVQWCYYKNGILAVICQQQLQMSTWANILQYFLEVFPSQGSRHLYILYCVEMQQLATVTNIAYSAT